MTPETLDPTGSDAPATPAVDPAAADAAPQAEHADAPGVTVVDLDDIPIDAVALMFARLVERRGLFGVMALVDPDSDPVDPVVRIAVLAGDLTEPTYSRAMMTVTACLCQQWALRQAERAGAGSSAAGSERAAEPEPAPEPEPEPEAATTAP